MSWIMMIDGLLQNLLLAGAVAAVLAVAVSAAGWRIRRPELMHGLWILVLLKMMTPPLVSWDVLPAPFASGQAGAGPTAVSPVVLPAADPAIGTGMILVLVLALGSVGLLGLLLIRVVRFNRLIGTGETPSPELSGRAEQIAGRLGLRSLPEILTVQAPISPMLWPSPLGCRLLLPEELLLSLTPREFDVLLAHELAHYRRKDHWVRYLEVAVTLLFWWNPVTWWVRRRLRVAEECSCDGMVLKAFPGFSRAYADALLKTVEFAGGHGPGTPVLATGAGNAQDLKERLTMIMKRNMPDGMSPGQRFALAVLAIAVLVVFPTWADKEPDAAQAAREAELARREAKLVEMEQKLEQQARLLTIQEKQLQEAMVQQQIQSRRMHDKAQDLARVEIDREQARMIEEQVQALEARARAVDLQAREMDHKARALAEYAEQLAVRERDRERLLRELEERRETMKDGHPELKKLEEELKRIQEELEKKNGTAL